MPFVEWQESVEGLVRPCDVQNALDIARCSSDVGPSEQIVVCGPCSSCLDVAWYLVRSGRLGRWDSVLCSSQWAGRGQMRRVWMSPEGKGNIYAAWQWPSPPRHWNTLLPLVAGYLLQRFFAETGIVFQIKWPNDLLFNGRKIGGILIEEKRDVILVGIGINLVWSPEQDMLRRETCIQAGNLSRFFQKTDFVSQWAELVSWGRFCYKDLLTSCTPADFVLLVNPLLAFLHQNVRVITGEDDYYACLMGLHEDGGAIIDRQGCRHVLYSGSILPLA